MDDNPLVRVLEVNGFLMDIRMAPREAQVAAYEKGLIPYRSSNYKDTRIFHPEGFPVKIDRRYLEGPDSTCHIPLGDGRGKNRSIYFERVGQIIGFLEAAQARKRDALI
jgi:hypothetical protein